MTAQLIPASIVPSCRARGLGVGQPLAQGIDGSVLHACEVESVTAREREILQMLTDGHGVDDVAALLCISEKTVKNHLCALYPKLRARTRVQAIVTALCVGLVRLPDVTVADRARG